MKKIPLTKGLFALVDDEDFDRLMQWSWFAKWQPKGRKFYAARRIGRDCLFLHYAVIPRIDGLLADHKNLDTLDCRKENLRYCSYTENVANKGIQRNNKSGFKGVSWDKGTGKWRARSSDNYKSVHLGLFGTPEEAHRAYSAFATAKFGEFARIA